MTGDRVIRTVCPRNCYCTCGMLITVRDGQIVQIEGDPLNPATGGKVCLKGLSYVERVNAPDRLHTPLRRNKGSDRFEPVSWEDALDGIAKGLEQLRVSDGPLSVFYYEGSGNHGALSVMADVFWNQFGGCTRAHGDLCWSAGLEATRLTYGANLHDHPVLTRESRFIMLWGHNPAETNIHQMRLIFEAQEKGAALAVIDPRSTDTSDAADIHLRPRPGTDAALAMGMANVLNSEGLTDRPFLGRNAVGVEPFLERAGEYPVERVAEITGLSEQEIHDLSVAYGSNRPALLIAGFGLQRHHHAGQTMRTVALLPALTGNIGVKGGGWQYANLASHVLREPPLPHPRNGSGRSIPTSRFGIELQQLSDPPVRAAWIEKANPVSQHPQTSRVRKALESMELVVVVDQFLTDTARMADYVLPAKTLFEEEDLVTAYWHPYLQLRQQVLRPPEGVKTETEIWQLLCQRFGFETDWFCSDRRELLRRMLPEGQGGLLERMESEPVMFNGANEVVSGSGNGYVAWHDGSYPTESGKIEFESEEASRLWGVDRLPSYEPLPEGHESEAASRYPLQLLTCKTRERIHSQFGNLSWIQEVDRSRRLDMHPEDALARGLSDGEMVAVWNDRGRVEIEVHFDYGIRQGVVHVIEGRCHPDDPWLNLLTDDGITDMNHGAIFYECLVEVGKP